MNGNGNNQIVRVALQENLSNTRIQQGDVQPCRVSTESPESICMIINSDDLIEDVSQSASNFKVSVSLPLYGARSVKLFGVSLPKIPNVNNQNNVIYIKHQDFPLQTTTVTLSPGYYNPTSLCNEIVSKINAQFVADGITDSVTCSYSSITKKFTLSSVIGEKFFITNESPFYIYGGFLCNFPALDSSLDPAVSGSISIVSGIAGMLSARYITVHSPELSQYSTANSLFSTQFNISDCIGVFDITQLYDSSDFEIGSASNVKLFSYIENNLNPKINICNVSSKTPVNIQIEIQNEFENYYLDSFDNPANTQLLGCTLYFIVEF